MLKGIGRIVLSLLLIFWAIVGLVGAYAFYNDETHRQAIEDIKGKAKDLAKRAPKVQLQLPPADKGKDAGSTPAPQPKSPPAKPAAPAATGAAPPANTAEGESAPPAESGAKDLDAKPKGDGEAEDSEPPAPSDEAEDYREPRVVKVPGRKIGPPIVIEVSPRFGARIRDQSE